MPRIRPNPAAADHPCCAHHAPVHVHTHGEDPGASAPQATEPPARSCAHSDHITPVGAGAKTESTLQSAVQVRAAHPFLERLSDHHLVRALQATTGILMIPLTPLMVFALAKSVTPLFPSQSSGLAQADSYQR